MKGKALSLSLLAGVFGVAAGAQGTVQITEWMYNGDEFIEFTNVGAVPVNMAGWSYDDDSRAPGTVDLSAFGTVAAGESVILAELDEATFRAAWGLDAAVKIIGSNATNLGRNDEINLYDDGNGLVDRLTYGDQNIPGTIRTSDISGNPSTLAALGANSVAMWQLSFVGDAFGSYASTAGKIGNPGTYVPEPATLALLALGGLSARRRR